MKFQSSLLAGACLILAGCGGAQETAAEQETPPPSVETPVSETEESPAATPAAAPAEAEPSAQFADLPEPYKSADYARGERQFKLCVACHLLTEEGGHRVGPNLHGMFGRQVGTAEGFGYSNALMEADFEWTPEQLNDWLENPRTFLPGNRMSFSGVRREEDRTALIAYLMVETSGAE